MQKNSLANESSHRSVGSEGEIPILWWFVLLQWIPDELNSHVRGERILWPRVAALSRCFVLGDKKEKPVEFPESAKIAALRTRKEESKSKCQR